MVTINSGFDKPKTFSVRRWILGASELVSGSGHRDTVAWDRAVLAEFGGRLETYGEFVRTLSMHSMFYYNNGYISKDDLDDLMEWAWFRKVVADKQEEVMKLQRRQRRKVEKELEQNVVDDATSEEKDDHSEEEVEKEVEKAAPKTALGVIGHFVKGIFGFGGADEAVIAEGVPKPAAEAVAGLPKPGPDVEQESLESLAEIVGSDELTFDDEEGVQRFVVAALMLLRRLIDDDDDDDESRMALADEHGLERIVCTISEKAAGALQEIGLESWQTIDKLVKEFFSTTGFKQRALISLCFLDNHFSAKGTQNAPVATVVDDLLQYKEKLFRIWPRLMSPDHRTLIHRIQGKWQTLLEARAGDIQDELAKVTPILSAIIFRAGFLDYVPYVLGADHPLEAPGRVFSDWHLSDDDWNPYMDDKYNEIKDVLEIVYDYMLADAPPSEAFRRKDLAEYKSSVEEQSLRDLRIFAQRLYDDLRGHASGNGFKPTEGLFELLDNLPIKGETWYVAERNGRQRVKKAVLQAFDDLSAAEVKELERHKGVPYLRGPRTAMGIWPTIRNACAWVGLVKDMLEERGIETVRATRSVGSLNSEEQAASTEAERVTTRSKGPKVLASTASRALFGAKKRSPFKFSSLKPSATSLPGKDTSMPDAPVIDTQGPALKKNSFKSSSMKPSATGQPGKDTSMPDALVNVTQGPALEEKPFKASSIKPSGTSQPGKDTSMPDAPVNVTQGPALVPAFGLGKVKEPRNYEERIAPQTGEIWYKDHPAHFPFAATPYMVAVQSRQVKAELRRG